MISYNSPNQDQDRFDQIVEMKQNWFHYESLREGIAEELNSDEQFRVLLVLSEQSRQFVGARDSDAGCDDSMRNSVAGYGETLDEALHRRADEVITEVCASYVRQDDRWGADESDSFDTTEADAYFDSLYRARQWLNAHEDIVAQRGITYPEDE
ncbi:MULTISPECIES: hypothetical protein [Halorubrum]|nr:MULTISPECIES: hypothetical protein [Halorubrum]TKX66195.1 hypothetical protein EXE40_16015 [Halorubrum sp. GN11GM_10-3_MGM]